MFAHAPSYLALLCVLGVASAAPASPRDVTGSATADSRLQEKPPDPSPGPTQKPAEKPPAAKPVPGQTVNIRLQITVTDQGSGGEASKKAITMLLLDGASGSIRSSGSQRGIEPAGPPGFQTIPQAQITSPVVINIDAQPTILRDDAIRVNLGLEYWPLKPEDGGQGAAATVRGQLNERLSLIVTSGKPVVVSEAADAATNRRVTVELVATILR